MKHASRIYICLIFAILYMPIATLILFSFTGSDSTAEFVGVSFKWYVELFSSVEAFTALRNTLILAVLSSLLATLIGTAAAEGIYKMSLGNGFGFAHPYLKGHHSAIYKGCLITFNYCSVEIKSVLPAEKCGFRFEFCLWGNLLHFLRGYIWWVAEY